MAEKQLAYRASGNDEFFADDDPLAELARIVGFEPRPAAQAAPAAQRHEPAFNLEDELLREFERYDTPRMSPANDITAPAEQVAVPSHEPVVHAAEPVQPEPKLEEPRFEEPKFEEPAPQPMAPVKPTIGARDLIDELEMSIAPVLQPAPKAAPIAQSAAPVAKIPQSAAATMRLPIANFTLATPVAPREQPAPVAAPIVAPPAPTAAPEEAMFDGALDFEAFEAVEPPRAPEPAAVPVASQPAPAVFRAPEPPKVVKADPAALAAEIDSLLADVNRYPVPSRTNAPAAKEEPDFGNFDVSFHEQKEPVAPAAVVQREEPKPITFGAEDPFAGQDFEFDLADIEMELAGLDFAEADKSLAARQPAPAPEPILSRATPVAPAAAPVMAAAAPQPMRAAPAPAPVAPVASVAPPVAKAAPVFEADQPLPFDPTEISETEERVETFEGSHVPHLPVIEPEDPVAVPPEFDFDLDSEMASLLGGPAKEAAPAAAKPVAAAAALGGAAVAASWSKNAAAQPAAPVAKQPIEEFDEFERALEEDFRRSYREASNPVENVARMTLNPAAGSRRPVRSVRGMVTTAAVIAVLGVGGYGAYSWIRHGAPISSFSGEPRVIAADSDPVKVAPENPGGTVVPNQDKAVYDRVAGDSTAAPKQKELVSSNEQPVDVVQKTLIPEAVSPDDSDGGGDQVTSTPVGETEDPRLLPNQNGGNTNVAANGDDQVPSVSPRKVRTMIVKPDGSLVPRDEPATDTATAVAKPTNNQVALANPTPSAANTQAAAQPDNGDAASAESTPIRVVKTNPVPTPRPEPTRANTAAPAHDAQPKQVAAATPATAAPAPATTSAAAGGAYGVQIASLPTEADAQKSQANLKVKFANIIGNHPLEIRKADIAGKGTYYRVRVVAGSKDEAAAICTRYRAAGGTCLISK
ncbi:SPOR domain-containing protein [Rhizobium sp. 60-20]|uniref:SPOR domain-containing protein n=1 Tax=Rhizobium sp. 60-20 TaxID=1895819 RepID=UPI000925DF57|nr:SPOR domain-containing protein [Rhizobium sp. 60-20]MBN8954418.1 SPOR domain-containing protein [Rhizobium tropici]OJY75906.1 MAG: sporulation protein [Rhizobium sp. 60-20]